jgi:hypothetical protein
LSLSTEQNEKKKSPLTTFDIPSSDTSKAPNQKAIEQLKGFVIDRFKYQKEMESNLQRVSELNEKIRNSRDKKLLSIWKTELKALNCVVTSSQSTSAASLDVMPLEQIQSLAQNLIHQFEEYEEELLDEVSLEASMLCEIDRLNLLNFLHIFEVEVTMDRYPPPPCPGTRTHESDTSKPSDDEEIFKLQKQISLLKEETVLLQYELIQKERAVKDYEAIIARSHRKDGIGLEVSTASSFICHPCHRRLIVASGSSCSFCWSRAESLQQR